MHLKSKRPQTPRSSRSLKTTTFALVPRNAFALLFYVSQMYAACSDFNDRFHTHNGHHNSAEIALWLDVPIWAAFIYHFVR